MKYAFMAIVVTAFLSRLLSGESTILTAEQQREILGGQETDKECHDTTATCDILIHGIVCGVELDEGDPCWTCEEQSATEHICITSPNDTCAPGNPGFIDCGDAFRGECEGAYCVDGETTMITCAENVAQCVTQ